MTDQFLAEIRIFPFNFAPQGWAFCDGQLVSLSQNTALFSLVGTTYGGNGITTFALPNLQGSVPLHVGANQPGPGLSLYALGETGGTETVTLLQTEIPNHTHSLKANTSLGDDPTPSGNVLARYASVYQQNTSQQNLVMMDPQSLPFLGSSQPHNNMQPYLTLNFCIALQGSYPARP